MAELYAQIILPLSLHDSYTYRVPESMQKDIAPGHRVIVQFGQKRLYAGLVFSLSEKYANSVEIKEIIQILDEKPIVLPENFNLWRWIADYYCCAIGDVFRAALPTGLKLESKSRIIPTEIDREFELNEKEVTLLHEINNEPIYLSEFQKKLGKEFSYTALKSLQEKNLVTIEEKVIEKYLQKTETYVKLNYEIIYQSILN